MLNLPDSLYKDYTQLSSASASASSSTTVVSPQPDNGMIFQWINDLKIRDSDNLLQHRLRSDFALQNLADVIPEIETAVRSMKVGRTRAIYGIMDRRDDVLTN